MDTIGARYSLGQRIRAMRKEQKLSVREFALMINLNKDYIVDIEYGRKSPTFDSILKISWGLNVTPSELMEGIGLSCTTKPCEDSPEKPTINYFTTHL